MDLPIQQTFTAQSLVGELPGWGVTFELSTLGSEVARLFREQPEVPGIIVLHEGVVVAALSQTRFLQTMSRPFALEIFGTRPLKALLEMTGPDMLAMRSDVTVQEAVEVCLERQGADMYEPFLVQYVEDSSVHIVDFRALLMASGQIFAQRNQQMDRILSSVSEGLLTIDSEFRVGPEYSKAVEEMFETKAIGGELLIDVLSRFLDEKTCKEASDYLAVLFNPRMIDRLIESVNPIKEVTAVFDRENGGLEKHFAIRFRRLKARGRISQVLVRVEDITKQVSLAKELEQQNQAFDEQMKSMFQMLHVDPVELGAFLHSFDERILEAAEYIQSNASELSSEERVTRIYRAVHGLKGEAGLLKLSLFQNRLHRYEEDIRKVQERCMPDDTSIEALSILVPGLADLTRISEDTKEQIELFRKIAAAVANSSEEKKPEAPETSHKRSSLPDPIDALRRVIDEMAERLSKPVAFHCTATAHEIPELYRPLLRETLIQLARNSLIHGIESAEERVAAGKPAAANIQFVVRKCEGGDSANLLEAIFQDDGRGLNQDKIRARLQHLGWPEPGENELENVIFQPGFSTAEETTMDAGRGVGLDLVKRRIEEFGGRVRVHSSPGVFCAFQILLPIQVQQTLTV